MILWLQNFSHSWASNSTTLLSWFERQSTLNFFKDRVSRKYRGNKQRTYRSTCTTWEIWYTIRSSTWIFVLQLNRLTTSSPRPSISSNSTLSAITLEWRTQFLSNYLFLLFLHFTLRGFFPNEIFPLSSFYFSVHLLVFFWDLLWP